MLIHEKRKLMIAHFITDVLTPLTLLPNGLDSIDGDQLALMAFAFKAGFAQGDDALREFEIIPATEQTLWVAKDELRIKIRNKLKSLLDEDASNGSYTLYKI